MAYSRYRRRLEDLNAMTYFRLPFDIGLIGATMLTTNCPQMVSLLGSMVDHAFEKV
jgi:hypothetical protein